MNPDLLSQLRDIHGASPAHWWPPAPGWWAVAMLAAFGLYFLFRIAMRNYGDYRRRLRLERFIDDLVSEVDPVQAPQEFISALNRVFKLVALRAFPAEHCAQLQGAEWVEFLGGKMKKARASSALAALADGPYRPAPEFDPEALVSLTRQWVRHYG